MEIGASATCRMLFVLLMVIPFLSAAAQDTFSGSLDGPDIIADHQNLTYNPMPFPVILTLTNTGNADTDTVFASIQIWGDLALAEADAPDKFTKILKPYKLKPSERGGISWMVRHPLTSTSKTYTIQVWVWTKNTRALYEKWVTIPAMALPVLQSRTYCPDSLSFNDATGKYEPRPFQVKATCKNTGSGDARDVSAQVILPPTLEFMDPNERDTKWFTPSIMHPYKKNDTIPYVTWDVRVKDGLPERKDRKVLIEVILKGRDNYARPTDPAGDSIEIRIPGVPPFIAHCHYPIPDSLVVDSTCVTYTDNPFSCRFCSYNQSWTPCAITNLQIRFSELDGIELDSTSSDPKEMTVHRVLHRNDTLSSNWKLRVLPRPYRRYIPIMMTALDDEGNQLICQRSLVVAGMPQPLFTSIQSSPTEVSYDSSKNELTTGAWVVGASLQNDCPYPKSNVRAELVLADSTMDFIRLAPGYPLNENPKHIDSIGPHASRILSWHLCIDSSKVKCGTYRVVFRVRYTADGIEPQFNDESGNGETLLHIVSSTTSVSPAMPGVFSLGQNLPNPFNGMTVIPYQISEAASVRLAVYDMLGKEVHSLVDGRREAGIHEAVFDASHLNPGVYFYRLEAGKQAATKMMVVVK